MGTFITVEGIEGSGKTSLISSLSEFYKLKGFEVLITKEPGGTDVGKRVREIVLHRDEFTHGIAPLAEVLLFAADRAQHCQTLLRPALEANNIVICDRFTSSTLAYQGYGGNIPLDVLHSLNTLATGGLSPDLTLLLDISPEKALQRAKQRAENAKTRANGKVDISSQSTHNDDWNHFEKLSLSFHERVRNGFLEIAKNNTTTFVIINAELPPNEVLALAIEATQAIIID